jgi:hypothetical protein
MPPKKKGEEPKKVILGRPGNNLKVSLVTAIMLSLIGNARMALTHPDWYCRCA